MNIIQTLLGLLNTPQLLEKLSGVLGESTSTTQKGLTAAIPAILGGLISKGSTESGAGSLIGMMKEHKIDGGMLDQLGGLFGGGASQLDAGNSMLKGILGDKLGGVAGLISSISGMSSGSASNLMSLAAPAVLGGVAKAAPSGGFSAASLMSLLGSQKEHLAKFAPPGLGSLLGISGLGATATSMAGAASSAMGSASSAAGAAMQGAGATAAAMTTGSSGLKTLWPWLLFAGVLGLAFLFGLKTCSTPTSQTVAEAPTPATPEPVTPAAPPAPEPVTTPAPVAAPTTAEIKLPSGATFTVPPGSVGENLLKFLTGSETGSKTFLFDGLTFETGRATLDASSQTTIATIASILKEFSTVNVSVDGFTDNKGSKGGNLRLSEARAKAVMAALSAAGVDAARIKAVGHGDDKPVADNNTEEGRAQNRRTELTATKN